MAAPSTIIRSGDGSSVVAYTLPAGLFQYIESVLVEVDNTAGADIRPTLRVKSDAGQVIATKRQGEAIPSGDTGTATWALRLTDERAAIESVNSLDGTVSVLNPTGPKVYVYQSQFKAIAYIFQSSPGAGALGGAGANGFVAPSENLTQDLACPVYLPIGGSVYVHLEQHSGTNQNVSVGLSALLIGKPPNVAAGATNMIGAQVRTAPVFTVVPSGATGADAVFQTQDFDTGAMVNLVTHPTTLVAATAGTYIATASVTWVP